MSRKYRKRGARRKRGYRRKLMVSKPIGGFGKTSLVRLTYAQEVTLNPLAGVFDTHQFRLNSIYDPDLTGAGHQPMNRDVWTQLYDHYTVLGARITASYVGNGSTTNVIPIYWGFIVDDGAGTTPYTAVTDVFENINAATGLAWRNAGITNIARVPNKTATLSHNFSAKKYFGVSKPQDGAAYGANTGANPGKQAVATLWGIGPAGTDGGSCNFLVQIEYIVLFDQLAQQTQN